MCDAGARPTSRPTVPGQVDNTARVSFIVLIAHSHLRSHLLARDMEAATPAADARPLAHWSQLSATQPTIEYTLCTRAGKIPLLLGRSLQLRIVLLSLMFTSTGSSPLYIHLHPGPRPAPPGPGPGPAPILRFTAGFMCPSFWT